MPGLLSSEDPLWSKVMGARSLFNELKGYLGRCIINYIRTDNMRYDAICNTAEHVIEATESFESTAKDLQVITTLEDDYNLSPIITDMTNYVDKMDNILRNVMEYEKKSQEILVE